MSVFQPRVVTCSGCGARSRRTVALSVSADRSPEYRAAILEGSFQRFSCDACGAVASADGPLLYIDLPARQWIGCFPRTWEGAWRALERDPFDTWRRVLIDHAPPAVRGDANAYQVRTVFGLGALAEKLRCFDAGIDDVELEVLKLELMRGGEPLVMDASARPLLADVRGTSLALTCDLPTTGEDGAQAGPIWLEVPRERLDAIARDPAFTDARRIVSEGPYVDLGRLLVPGTAARPPGF